MLLRIPYSRLNHEIVSQLANAGSQEAHILTIEIDKTSGKVAAEQLIRTTILNMPWSSLKEDVAIKSVGKSEEGGYLFEVSIFSMENFFLSAISPIDGRYRSKVEECSRFFSEGAIIRYRVQVEVEYFIALCEIPLPQLKGVDEATFTKLREIYRHFTTADALRVKEIETITNHALFSLIVVAFGYKLADRMGGRKAAIQVGLALSFLWFMPLLSVRNLVEVACIPFIMTGVWMTYVAIEESRSLKHYLFAGLVIGLAFSIRFQTVIFIGGVGLVILFRRKFWEAIIFGLGALISIILIQGVVDMFIWGRPFAELMEYIRYNIVHKADYGTNNPYMYASIIIGVLLPPLGWLWIVGFFRSWKKTLIIVVPTLLFTAFHSYFPNKQERFIFPVLPFFVTAGIIGWYKIRESKFWVNHPGFIKWLSIVFWVLNIALLLPISVSSSKLSRVNAMYYLYGKSVPHDGG